MPIILDVNLAVTLRTEKPFTLHVYLSYWGQDSSMHCGQGSSTQPFNPQAHSQWTGVAKAPPRGSPGLLFLLPCFWSLRRSMGSGEVMVVTGTLWGSEEWYSLHTHGAHRVARHIVTLGKCLPQSVSQLAQQSPSNPQDPSVGTTFLAQPCWMGLQVVQAFMVIGKTTTTMRLFPPLFKLHVFICVPEVGGPHATMCTWRSEDNLWELIFFFLPSTMQSWGLNSGHQPWWQAPLPSCLAQEPSW